VHVHEVDFLLGSPKQPISSTMQNVRDSPMKGPSSVSSSHLEGSGKETECIVFGVCRGPFVDDVEKRVQALCDDGCLKANVFVREQVMARKDSDRTLSIRGGGMTEIRVRTTSGHVIKQSNNVAFVAAGQPAHLHCMNGDDRVEVNYYGQFQKFQKNSRRKLDSPVRAVTRFPIACDVDLFFKRLGYAQKFEVSYSGTRYLTRDSVEIDLFRLTKEFKSDVFLVMNHVTRLEDAPMAITIRGISPNDSEIERTSARVRRFANNLTSVSEGFTEVKQEAFNSGRTN